MNITIAVIAGIMHIFDMLFTVLYIRKIKKEDIYHTPEDIEINYHRFFFKKFGLIKGAFLSSMISLPVIISIALFANKETAIFITGMQTGIAYVNYMSWVYFDKLRQLKKRRIDERKESTVN